ncbi:glycine cleavage system aminomethyltransferase GcvT [Kribbella albertanoniae]|uniref:Aminomethyltransferase n=1 Tax=Kribbella albertanoniae TaxID=1266829 RepID=A0A4R4QBH3_9ACTN|nr:glycine cleavage system aminomethyltransferase GcvT [Kribbella albertanoniae]TDC32714.1 glycine cleavage system aminomethyltransferase GcvT [Kribbella albertanoniae]
MSLTRATPLAAEHQQLGASFTDFAGWTMPVRYTSDIAEHNAVRTTAGLFDLSHMGELEVVGACAARALDHSLVGTPSKIGLGRARYSMLCAEDGGVIDDLVVYRLADDHFLIVANASNTAVVRDELKQRIAGYETELRDTTDDWALIAVQGPVSAQIVAPLTYTDLTDLKYYEITETKLANSNVLLARTGYTGEDGFEIYCRPADASQIWAELLRVGTPYGLKPCGLACRDTLRLEAGMPLYGNELSRELTPFEAGLGRVVAFGKEEDFVGREALARRRDEGAQRVLVGLTSSARRSPRSGYAVLDPATGREVGTVTSGAPSPTLGHPIAMAYVEGIYQEPGTRLQVDIRGTHDDVVVVPLPFYRRQES